jgi:UDP-glucose 4-epimerase
VVITGGAGFIGSHVCRAVRERGHGVVVLDDLSTGKLSNLTGLDVDLVEGSILDPIALAKSHHRASAIIHLAARPSVPRSLQDPLATHEANATGTLRVLEAARVVGAYTVVASSSSVYGANRELPKRESTTPNPISPYAVSKLAGEGYTLSYLRCFSLDALVFRFFNVFGPRQAADHAYAAVVPRFIEAALAGKALEIHGDGEQTRDFTYVETVAAVLADAVDRRVVHDGAVNLAFGTRTSLLQLVTALERLLGHAVDRRHTDPRPGDVRDSQADNALLRSLFPGTNPIQLSVGLAATLEWMRGHHGAGGATAHHPAS